MQYYCQVIKCPIFHFFLLLIFLLTFFFQIIGSVSRWHKNPTVKVPITIGTHPYSDLLLTEPNENIFDDDTSSTLSLLNENSGANEYLNDGKLESWNE